MQQHGEAAAASWLTREANLSAVGPHDLTDHGKTDAGAFDTPRLGIAMMARRNLTVHLDVDVIRRARVVAAKRGTSISAMVARELDDLVAREDRYEEARDRALELMASAKPRGARAWTRDDIYAERLTRYDR